MGCKGSKKSPVLDRSDLPVEALRDPKKSQVPICNLSRSVSSDEEGFERELALKEKGPRIQKKTHFDFEEKEDKDEVSPMIRPTKPPHTPHPKKHPAKEKIPNLQSSCTSPTPELDQGKYSIGSTEDNTSDLHTSSLPKYRTLYSNNIIDIKSPSGLLGIFGVHPNLGYETVAFTKAGFDADKGCEKENQDGFSLTLGLEVSLPDSESETCDEKLMLGMMLDGHGQNGRAASVFALSSLLQHLAKEKVGTTSLTATDDLMVGKALHHACIDTNTSLVQQKDFDVFLSGSTAVIALLKEKALFVANIGDSRGVLGRLIPSQAGMVGKVRYEAVDLTTDHKPDVPEEQARVLRNKGRVFTWGVPRVWLQDQDLPGLAMSRSLGDSCAKQVGVIPDPDITKTMLEPEDVFLILATDGVFEFIDNQEAVQIVGELYNKIVCQDHPELTKKQLRKDFLIQACDSLINIAVQRWKETDETIDDCTCMITLFPE